MANPTKPPPVSNGLYRRLANHFYTSFINKQHISALAQLIVKEISAEVYIENARLLWKVPGEIDLLEVYSNIPEGDQEGLSTSKQINSHIGSALLQDDHATVFLAEEILSSLTAKLDDTKVPASWLGAAITSRSHRVGVFSIFYSDQQATSHREIILELLNFIAPQWSIVAEHSASIEGVRAQTERLNAVFDSSNHIIWTVDNGGELTSFNQRFYDTFLKDRERQVHKKIQGQNWQQADIQMLAADFQEKLAAGDVVVLELKVKAAKGYIRLETFLNPIRSDEGDIVEIAGIANDITERERNKKVLAAAKVEVEESLAAKEQFLANLSHEIRTPLNGVVGMLDILRRSKLTNQQQKYLDIIDSSSLSLMNLLNDILDMSAIEAGRAQISTISFNPSETLEEVVALFFPQALQKKVDIDLVLDKGIPTTAIGDKTKTSQILSNLISNAIKFSDEGGKVRISLTKHGGTSEQTLLRFVIDDEGIGIAKQNQKKIFKTFTQVDASSSKKYKGVGLGLAIAKELALILGGEIGLKSQVDKGSTFWLELPFAIPPKSRRKSTAAVRKEKQNNGGTSLLVDDNHINRLVAAELLSCLGLEATTASSGKSALELVSKSNFSIIFMDIQMPELDGLQTMMKLRKRHETLPPIIAMTAYTSASDRKKFLKAGFDGFISKPLRAEDLQRAMAGIFEDPKKRFGNTRRKKRPLDMSILEQLRRYCSEEVVKETYAEFITESTKQIAACQKAIAAGAHEKALEKLHSLKGNAGTVGAEEIANKAERIEYHLKNNNYKSLNREIDFLKLSFEEFKYCLKKLPI